MSNTEEMHNVDEEQEEEDTIKDSEEATMEEGNPVEGMGLLAVFNWSKVVGVTSTLKDCTVYFDNGHNADVHTPWFMEGNTEILMTKQFNDFLKEKKATEAKRQTALEKVSEQINNIELALKFAPNDIIGTEFVKAKEHFQQMLGQS